jgi:hypothetical protein
MDRFTLAVVGGVLVLVTAGLIAAASVRTHTASPPDLTTPSGVALAYALAEQRGDAQTAWDLLATSTQQRGDRERFLARAGSSEPDNTFITTEDERLDGDGASVVLVRTYAGTGGIFGRTSNTNRTTVRLIRETNNWRITVPPDDYLLLVTPARP